MLAQFVKIRHIHIINKFRIIMSKYGNSIGRKIHSFDRQPTYNKVYSQITMFGHFQFLHPDKSEIIGMKKLSRYDPCI